MRAETRRAVQAELDAIEATAGGGGGGAAAAMLCALPNRLVLARSAGAPTSQGRADALARDAIALGEDPVAAALFAHAEAAGDPALARRLTDGEGCIGLIRAPGTEEAVVLGAHATAQAAGLLSHAGRLFGLLASGEAAQREAPGDA